MEIIELFTKAGITLPDRWKNLDAEVTGLEYDSRQVSPGKIFFAVKGINSDGHDFISSAVKNGAVAIVGSRSIAMDEIPYIQVADAREALAYTAAAFNGFPARKLNIIGVTGTDGKTTTVNLIFKILVAAGIKAGMISTINAVVGDEVIDTGFHVTTPEAPTIQGLLRKMTDHGLTHVVLEITSHGLDQRRAAACEIDTAVITNITHEHLDYHGNYDGYFDAKFRLVEELLLSKKENGLPQKIAVFNHDDISFERLVRRLSQSEYKEIQQIHYGRQPGLHISAEDVIADENGVRFSVILDSKRYPVSSPLMGEYNVHNILAAIAVSAQGLGLELETVIKGIALLDSVSGRMEKIDLGQDFLAIVDFAHTPNALKVALHTARKMTDGRVIAVFGSAGLRDKQKRRMMAAESIQYADISIITAEDPRTENLADILAEMADEGMKNGGVENRNFYIIPDRGDAIRKAVQLAQSKDLVIACGKGHEQSMCFGETEYAWDDRQAMRAALSELLGKPGPPMPFLPTSSR
jgi:UDP-N-acetylmuramoyl-L-alanyl-D-glutamate--2,6-diaminopimelate ligase